MARTLRTKGPSVPLPGAKSIDDMTRRLAADLARQLLPDPLTLESDQTPDGILTPASGNENDGALGDGSEETSDTTSDSLPAKWDFVLPDTPHPGLLIPGMAHGQPSTNFIFDDVVGAVIHGASSQTVQPYLAYYGDKVVRPYMQADINGFPSIFYAVGSNNVDMVRLWISYGASVSAVHKATGVPLLAFAIVNAENLEGRYTTAMVATLTGLDASPRVIPEHLYTTFATTSRIRKKQTLMTLPMAWSVGKRKTQRLSNHGAP